MNLTQSVLDNLRMIVVAGELAPGATVSEGWVCERFGVARPTAKSAIDRLASEGILVRDVNRPARVPVLTAESVEDLYEARLVIEVEATARLSATKTVTPEMLRAQRIMSVSTDEPAEFIAADVRFHRALVAAACSPRLTAMHDLVIGETHFCMARVRTRLLLHPEAVVAEHTALLRTIQAGNSMDSTTLVRDHIRWAKSAVIESL